MNRTAADIQADIAALESVLASLRAELAAVQPEPSGEDAEPSSEISAPNGVVFRIGDRVTFGASHIVRVIKSINGGAIWGVREDGDIRSSAKWTKQLNRVKHVYI